MRPTLLPLLLFPLLLPAQDQVLPAINEIEPWQQVGQQPYELTWTQRSQDPRTLVDFESLKDWTLALYGGASGELRRSREQQMWGRYVAKFTYSGAGAESRIVARPPKPVPIPGAFDSIDLWGYGNRWSWVDDKTTPPAFVAILLADARGKEFRVELTDIRWKQWWLIHRKIPADTLRGIALPASFAGIEISKIAHPDPRYFYCDSLVFYTEELKPLSFEPQPKRNLQPWRAQNPGLNTGPGTLPFPTREETILPSNFDPAFQLDFKETAPRRFELRYRSPSAAIVYEYRPRAGLLSEITASVNGAPPFRPLDGGGVRFTDTPEALPASGELLSARLHGDVVEARFKFGVRIVEYQLRLWQKSLVLDVSCDGGDAVELSFGRVAGIDRPRLITVPYITYGRTNPRVLLSGPESSPVFASVWFDWYRSNASQPFTPAEPALTPTSAEINGGLRYLPKTDGLRNNLYERIFVTASPVYEEVLPTIPNPPSLRQKEGSEVLWTVTQPETFEADHKRSRLIRSYGLDKIMQHSHEVTWRDEGDSFTMRLRAAPQKGGDATLQWYIHAQNSLGWLQGAYTNYTDFAPVNTNWSPDHVLRLSSGEWKRAWPRNYTLKPAKAVEFDEYYARRIKEKYGVRMSYTDVHSAVAPWDNCDFDARVPGAGTLAATFYAYGQLLLNDQRVYGPTQSEATYQWLYAGLASGHYGWVYSPVNLLTHPPDVAFMLHKIHPLECDYGMGYTSHYLNQLDPEWKTSPKKRDYVDLFLATTIAYGNMGWLVTEYDISTPFGLEAMLRSYYMMQQLQQQYAFVPPKTIEYATPSGTFLSAAAAHATGAIHAARLHVVYANGTEVFVNRAPSGAWTVRDHQARPVELPPSGWLVFNPRNRFYEFSATQGGRRIDYVSSSGYEYLDGRGEWTRHGSLAASGAVVLRHKAPGLLELIDLYGNASLAFAAPPGGTLLAYSPEGEPLGKTEFSSNEGWIEFTPVPGARSYLYSQ